MDYDRLDDEMLLTCINSAQAGALDELYQRYNRLVFTVAVRTVGDQAAAEEITLDVFTNVWEKADTFRADRGSVRVWLTGMTRNRAIDILRKSDVRQNVQQKLWAEAALGSNIVERKPETTADLRMRRERIREAIGQLSEEQRDVLALSYFRGLTHREIAKLRDMPLGTVKTRIRSAIQTLRRILEEDQFK